METIEERLSTLKCTTKWTASKH